MRLPQKSLTTNALVISTNSKLQIARLGIEAARDPWSLISGQRPPCGLAKIGNECDGRSWQCDEPPNQFADQFHCG
jgi:hypothetical protein